MRDLSDKTALVTGGGQGIGRGIALELANAGANVVVTQRNLDVAQRVSEEIRHIGRRSIALRMDVSDEESVRDCVSAAFARFPRIDIVVNNAGVAQSTFYAETDLEEFDSCYAVNLRGAWCVSSALIPHFRQHKSGRIINIASIEGRRGTIKQPAYAASKAAMISMTQSLATILGPDNINVNAICPGPVWTPQQASYNRLAVQNGEMEEKDANEQDFYRGYINLIPLRRIASPADIGLGVVFLASASARNITGQALNVDGGMFMN